MRRLFPVIHIENEAQAFEQAILADNCGADGVFLIHHKRKHTILFEIAESIHRRASTLWIGLNALDLEPREMFRKCPVWVNGIWCDDGGIEEDERGVRSYQAQATKIIRE